MHPVKLFPLDELSRQTAELLNLNLVPTFDLRPHGK